nr:MAG TPA: hypothetical protein [Caudoviricetes sp.]
MKSRKNELLSGQSFTQRLVYTGLFRLRLQ